MVSTFMYVQLIQTDFSKCFLIYQVIILKLNLHILTGIIVCKYFANVFSSIILL